MSMVKPELLAPAGDLEKLKIAVAYGADAVYVGGEQYSLRANAGNFTLSRLREGIELAHAKSKKVYVAVNIFAKQGDTAAFAKYITDVSEAGADALIVSDTGLFGIIRKTLPKMDIHISTQANITNAHAANFWYEAGAKRVVLSRELALDEIHEIRQSVPNNMVIECFVHGAMCLSFSGRCYLSQYLNGRDANQGDCSQPCRWKYALMEEKREGEYFPVFEDEKGAYILNSKDMRMVGHIPELVSAGIGSFKIEGRMKSAYYVASTIKAYRSAIDDFFDEPARYGEKLGKYLAETEKSSHRNYYTGFYFGEQDGQNYASSSYIRGWDYVALVLGYDAETGMATVAQRNKFSVGDELEVLAQEGDGFSFTVTEMYDADGKVVTSAPHAEQILKICVPGELCEYNMLRRTQIR